MTDDEGCLRVDCIAIPARPGQSVAAALVAAGIRLLRRSPRNGEPRGALCMMGVCQECLVRIDGRLQQACMTRVVPGMSVVLDR
jgi:predicted molibdopterin-dependent oxidoreductase YjgC